MTTSLPNPKPSLIAGNPAGTTGNAALRDAFTAVFANSSGGQPVISGQPDFATWLDAPVDVGAVPVAAANNAPAPKTTGLDQVQVALNPSVAVEVASSATSSVGAFSGPRRALPVTVSAVKTSAAVSSPDNAAQPVHPAVSRDLVETVAALVAPVLQSLQNVVSVQVQAAADQVAVGPTTPPSPTARSSQTPSETSVPAVAAKTSPAPRSAAVVPDAPALRGSISVGFALAKPSALAAAPAGPAAIARGSVVSAVSESAMPDPVPVASGQVDAVPSSQLEEATLPALQVVIDFGSSIPAVSVTLSGLASSPVPIRTSMAELRQAVTAALGSALAKSGVQLARPSVATNPSVAATPSTPVPTAAHRLPAVSVTINMPPFSGQTPGRGNPANQPAAKVAPETIGAESVANDTVAKIAGDAEANLTKAISGMPASEKNFLVAQSDAVKAGQATTGISVAKTKDNMPANFTARRNAASLADPVLPIVLRETAIPVGAAEPAPLQAQTASTPAPLLAHRAVETVLNVIEAQNNRPAGLGVVNLHFKFGSEDLAVRVQLRGGEVHTQFNTDSTELRTALSNEWRAVTGQGTADGLRLAAPVFGSSAAGSDHGFGSAPQGQFSSQQHPQQPPAPAMFPGLRALRQGANAPAEEVAASLPRPPVALPTSLHLAAVA